MAGEIGPGDVATETYWGYELSAEYGRSLRTRQAVCWVNIDQGDAELFRVKMSVKAPHPLSVPGDLDLIWIKGAEPKQMALQLGLRWARGLISLGRFANGTLYEEDRDEHWRAPASPPDENETRLQLLTAFRRMYRAEQGTSAVHQLDVAGVADVLGLPHKLVQEVLAEMVLEGLVEGFGEAFGRTAIDGACRITTAGLAFLRQAMSRQPEPALTAERVSDTQGESRTAEVTQAPSKTEAERSGPRVLMSYSHDSAEHEARTRQLADRLNEEGVDCHLDQYVAASPREGWPRWMVNQIEQAVFIVVVVTETYARRFAGREQPGKGLGARWEGRLLTQALYEAAANDRVVPVVFDPADVPHIPLLLRDATRYDLSTEDGYERLYRHITGQPAIMKPAVGTLRRMPPLPSPPPEVPASRGRAVEPSAGSEATLAEIARMQREALVAHEDHDLPKFERAHVAYTAREESYTPSFKLRKVSGEEISTIEARFRGPRFRMPWKVMPVSRLAGTPISHSFDLRQEPAQDDRVARDELGLEIRFFWRGRWRHELHRWPLTRRTLENKVLWDDHDELLPELRWVGGTEPTAPDG